MPEKSEYSEDFLSRFYQSENVEYGIGKAGIGSPGGKTDRKNKRPAESVIIGDDSKGENASAVSMDTRKSVRHKAGTGTRSYQRYKGRTGTGFTLIMLLIVFPALIAACMYMFRNAKYSPQNILQVIFGSRVYYAAGLIMIFCAIAAFLVSLEGRKPRSGEVAVLAALAALACAGRAVFYMLPSVKPVTAVVIVTGAAFGGEAGFLVGALSMLVSNFLFGQGPWTPWQMYAMGMIGFIAGLIYSRRTDMPGKLSLSVFGFIMAFVVYGGIMNPAALIMSVGQVTVSGLISYYIAGVPVDLVHAASTFIFLWLGGKPLFEKLERVRVKYGLYHASA